VLCVAEPSELNMSARESNGGDIDTLTPVPSPRGRGFGGLSPPNKASSPQIEIWNTINWRTFGQIWMSSPPART